MAASTAPMVDVTPGCPASPSEANDDDQSAVGYVNENFGGDSSPFAPPVATPPRTMAERNEQDRRLELQHEVRLTNMLGPTRCFCSCIVYPH